MTAVATVVAVVCAVAIYLTWTAGRLDRMTTRVTGAWAALDAQLLRRANAATELAAHARRRKLLSEEAGRALEAAAVAATSADSEAREAAENDLSRAIRDVIPTLKATRGTKAERLLELLGTAATRVGFARQFYNDAVRDARALRRRWVCRMLLLRNRTERPSFFEIDDTGLVDSAPPEHLVS